MENKNIAITLTPEQELALRRRVMGNSDLTAAILKLVAYDQPSIPIEQAVQKHIENQEKKRKTRVVLSMAQREQIKTMLTKGARPIDLAERFRVSPVTISNVKRDYKTLKHRPKSTEVAA